jgi:hypothetical protein
MAALAGAILPDTILAGLKINPNLPPDREYGQEFIQFDAESGDLDGKCTIAGGRLTRGLIPVVSRALARPASELHFPSARESAVPASPGRAWLGPPLRALV